MRRRMSERAGGWMAWSPETTDVRVTRWADANLDGRGVSDSTYEWTSETARGWAGRLVGDV